MSAKLRELIRLANQELHSFLSQLGRTGTPGTPNTLTPAQVQKLAKRIEQVENLLRHTSLPEQQESKLKSEFIRYVGNLESLQAALEKVRCDLMARQWKLKEERTHLASARAWAASCKEAS